MEGEPFKRDAGLRSSIQTHRNQAFRARGRRLYGALGQDRNGVELLYVAIVS